MKLSRCGICSRSEGTGVEPSRKGSRLKCVLSKMMVTTWVILPRGELSWHPPAVLGAAGAGPPTFAATRAAGKAAPGAAHAGAADNKVSSAAVPAARACRCHLAKAFTHERSLV